MEVFLSSLQLQIEEGDIERNLQKVEYWSKFVPKGGILLLPEMFCCGFDFDHLKEFTKQSDLILDFLKELSTTLEGVVVGTLPVEVEGKIYNTAFVFDKGKLVAKRGKIKLFPLYKEPKFFNPAPEEDNRVIETSLGRLGIVICFEIRFNQITNKLRREGVEIVLVPAMWGIERREHFKVLTRARAVETQSFLIASNGWGKSGKTFFGGSSGIYSPWGEILAYKEDGEGLIFAKVDLSEVQRVRKKLPVEF